MSEDHHDDECSGTLHLYTAASDSNKKKSFLGRQRDKTHVITNVKSLIQKKQQIKEEKTKEQLMRTVSTINSLSPEEISELIRVVMDPNQGVDVRDRKNMGKTYRQSFIGSELVTWLIMNNYSTSRKQALEIGNFLYDKGLFIHVTQTNSQLKDENAFYQFQTSEKIKFEPYEDTEKESEWKRREGNQKDNEFIFKIIRS